MDEIIHTLTKPEKLWSRKDILVKPSPVPKRPGIYAWYFKEIPPKVPTQGCVNWQGLTLLYLGISPKSETSMQYLAKRIRDHYNGNAYGSTLRKSLGCLLREKLDIHLQQVGNSGKRIHFADGESVLSHWMAENAFVCWVIQEKPWTFEYDLFQRLDLPMNLRGNESHPFYDELIATRKACKQEAM